MNYMKHLKANWKVAFHSFNDFLEHFIHGLLPCIKWEHKQPAILPNKTILPKSTKRGGCLQCSLQTEKEAEESYKHLEEIKERAKQQLSEIDKELIDGKISLLDSVRQSYAVILKEEYDMAKKELQTVDSTEISKHLNNIADAIRKV